MILNSLLRTIAAHYAFVTLLSRERNAFLVLQAASYRLLRRSSDPGTGIEPEVTPCKGVWAQYAAQLRFSAELRSACHRQRKRSLREGSVMCGWPPACKSFFEPRWNACGHVSGLSGRSFDRWP